MMPNTALILLTFPDGSRRAEILAPVEQAEIPVIFVIAARNAPEAGVTGTVYVLPGLNWRVADLLADDMPERVAAAGFAKKFNPAKVPEIPEG